MGWQRKTRQAYAKHITTNLITTNLIAPDAERRPKKEVVRLCEKADLYARKTVWQSEVAACTAEFECGVSAETQKLFEAAYGYFNSAKHG